MNEFQLNNLQHIEVVDMIMGSGKSWASLRYVEGKALSDKSNKWIYCTEFLSEIASRTSENPKAKHLWITPTDESSTKLEDLIRILKEDKHQLIAITHSLLKEAAKSKDFQRLVAINAWQLYLDETIDCINPYYGISASEFMWHYTEGRLRVNTASYGKVQWVDDSVTSFSGSGGLAVDKLLSEQQRVHAAIEGNRLSLVTVEDASMFSVFHRVVLSTYQFEGTLMASWLGMKGITHLPCKDIVPTRTTSKLDIKKNIDIITKYNHLFNKLSLSSSWYESKATAEDYSLINKTIRNIGDSSGCKGAAYKMGYTLPSTALGKQKEKKKVQPLGYKHTECMLDVDGNEIEGTKCKRRSGHIPCNARASNEYADKVVMVHVYDRHPHVCISNYLQAYKVEFSRERFALNELVQWVWRSAIRHGKPIKLAILSKRMLAIFNKWIED